MNGLIILIIAMLIYDIVRLTFKLKHTDTYYAVVLNTHDGKTKVYLHKTKGFAEYRADRDRHLFKAFGAKVAVVRTDTYGKCDDEGTLK